MSEYAVKTYSIDPSDTLFDAVRKFYDAFKNETESARVVVSAGEFEELGKEHLFECTSGGSLDFVMWSDDVFRWHWRLESGGGRLIAVSCSDKEEPEVMRRLHAAMAELDAAQRYEVLRLAERLAEP